MSRVVLVTGVSRDLGARFARALATDETLEVIGVDVSPPRHDLGKVSFVRADIRNPVIGKVINSRGVETVVHMAIVANPGTGGRSSMKEINVIGTMQLLAACQKADSFRKLVVQSSVSVYGASPRDPVKFTEDMSPRVQPRTGFGKDSLEIESYVRGLGRRRPDVAVTTLRLGNLMGAGVDSQMTRYLSLPVVPRVMGFDARLQFLHPTDAVGALLAVTREDHPGTYNVGRARHRLVEPGAATDGSSHPRCCRCSSDRWSPGCCVRPGLGDWSADQIAALTYGRAMDTTRFVAATGLKPRFTSRAALEEFVGVSSPGLLSPERVDQVLSRESTGLLEAAGQRPGTRVAEAEIIQLGSRGKAGRGSGKAPSAAARGLAPAAKARAAPGQDHRGRVPPPRGPRTRHQPVEAVEPTSPPSRSTTGRRSRTEPVEHRAREAGRRR